MMIPRTTAQEHYLSQLSASQGSEKFAAYQNRLAITLGDDKEGERSYAILDWFARSYAPVWYDLSGYHNQASAIRELPEIIDNETAKHAEVSILNAQKAIPGQWVTSHHPTWETAWTAAWHRAGLPAWSTGLAATAANLGATDLFGSWDNIWFSTWNVSQNAAWSDAQSYQRVAAQNSGMMAPLFNMFGSRLDKDNAAWDSILSVAKKALAPAIEEIHVSSVELLERII